MFKNNKLLVGIITFFSIVLLSIYIIWIKLDIYDYDEDRNKISKDGIVFQLDQNLSNNTFDNSKTSKIIGRCRNDNFLGFKTWIITLNGIDAKNTF